jgi:ankyrin repeat protein
MKEKEELLLYQSIKEHDFDLFLKTLGYHDLKWLNSVVPGYVFDLTTPLELAIEVCNQPVVTKILSMGGDPSFYLHTAIVNGNSNIVKILFDAGAKISFDTGAEIEDVVDLLSEAAKWGNLEILKLIIENGGDLNSYNDWMVGHPLVSAIANGHIHIYEYLIGIDTDQKDTLNIVALHETAREGNIKALKFLINKGIDVNSTHHLLEACTPLMVAVVSRKWDIVDYLISVGANVDLQDNFGVTALMRATSHNSMILVKKLIAAGANKNLKDVNGKIALDFAIERRDKILVKLLK